MKKAILSIVLLAYVLQATAQPGYYKFKRKLDSIAGEGYYAIPLIPEVTAFTRNTLNDIRLYAINKKDTVEIPYIIDFQGDKTTDKTIDFDIINDVKNEKCCSYITLKLKKKCVLNSIMLDIEELNFDKTLSIEGSNDNKQWFTIRSKIRIVGFENSISRFYSTTLNFNNAEYEYFRIKLDDDSSPKVNVRGAFAFEKTTSKGSYEQIKVVSKTQTENKKNKTTEIIVSAGLKHRISYIRLIPKKGTDFYRNVNIYKSMGMYPTGKGQEEVWQLVASGILSSDNENIYYPEGAQTDKLKIEILNQDNPPVNIDDIQLFYEQIALIAKLPANVPVYLCYGYDRATEPQYDLLHFKDKIPQQLEKVGYGNAEIKIETITPKHALIENQVWLWVAICSLVVLIGYFALKMIKSEQNQD